MNREDNPSSGSSEEVPQENPDNHEIPGEEYISEDWNPVEGSSGTTDSIKPYQDRENNSDVGIQASNSVSSDNYVVVGSSESEVNGEKKLKIVVRPLNGRDLTVEASQTSTIRQLKVLIEVQSGIEAINQRLIFRGRCMLDDDTVGAYIKEDGVIIHLVPYARNQRNESSAQSTSESRPRASGVGGATGNVHNLFAAASGMPGLNTSIGGFPGAMMFGAIRLDGETGLPMEAEDLMQRVLRTFGDAVNGNGLDPNSVGASSGTGDNRNISSVTFNSFGIGQPSTISGLSGLVSSTERRNTDTFPSNNETRRNSTSTSNGVSTNNAANSSSTNTGTENRGSSNIGGSNIDHTGSNTERRSSSNSAQNHGSFRGSNGEGARGDPMNSNPIGRIGTIVSRIFQAFNQPVGEVIQEGSTRSEGRDSQAGAGRGTGTRTNAGSNTNLGSGNTNTGTSERTSRNTSQDTRGRVIATPASGLSWTQIASSGALNTARTGVLPIGRPGLAVATIPISNFSIPITIRATSSAGIPSINLSQNSNVIASGATTTSQGEPDSGRVPHDTGNATESSSNVSEAYRTSSDNFFKNISNVLEDSANQLRTVAAGIREMSGLECTNGREPNQESFSALPPIPSNVSSRSVSGENLVLGQASDYIQHHSHRLYISNEVVHRFLPWDSLNELMDVLERDCGWRRPRITIPPPIDSMDSGPLAIFISVYLQAMSIVQSNLMQIQAWQERFARLDIPRLCYTVHLLALISHISAHLGSLLAWLFQNMAQYVEQDRLIEGLQWNRSSKDGENSGALENDGAPEVTKRINIDEEPSTELIGDSLNNANLEQNSLDTQNNTIGGVEMLERSDSSLGINNANANSSSNLGPDLSNEIVINQLPKEIREKWERWTGNPQNFSRNVFASFSTRPFSDTYQQGDVFSSSSSFGFQQPSNESANVSSGRINSHPTTQELLRMIIHQTEANLNISGSLNSRNYTNIQNEYRSMLIRDLINIARNDSDFLNDRSRFPYLQRIISLLYE
ncbi:UB domain-containing protein [Cryptosporidium ubiquitum]|uniref:UB domain-containing protein n=1 Tax=Cryptosporidium ubiquitum TaxID=857276 RepID=A0A1J4M9X9_9CRYT|nr:UB domain-containing protein [Cryptosporidium ubiquitum]OII70799.1 UB domain-containing protein [Cryptosporidium ubiquitum]